MAFAIFPSVLGYCFVICLSSEKVAVLFKCRVFFIILSFVLLFKRLLNSALCY